MSYKGYRLKIEGAEISNLLISKGSYSFRKDKREAGSWTDANGISHFDNHKTTKAFIQFAIKEHTLAEHESIAGIFEKQEKVAVEYWDDYACKYVAGSFRMNAPGIKHIETPDNDIRYATIQITLEEY